LAVGGNLGGGNGSEVTPYLIEDDADFLVFADTANAATYWATGVYTRLDTDLDLSGESYDTAIIAPDTAHGNQSHDSDKYLGHFDGAGHIISNLTITSDGGGNWYLGLFGYIGSGGEVKNLTLENISIAGGWAAGYFGALAGYNEGGTVDSCHVKVTITGSRGDMGGLVGANVRGSLVDCTAKGSVSGGTGGGGYIGGLTSRNNREGGVRAMISGCCAAVSVEDATVSNSASYLGGLVGENFESDIFDSCATGSVFGGGNSYYVGGLVGNSFRNYTGIPLSIIRCYATGAVTGGDGCSLLGGLAGSAGGTISDCYATGAVTGGASCHQLGGLVGYLVYPSAMSNCYAAGAVGGGGSSKLGGLVGKGSEHDFTACFWDVETSGTYDGVGNLDPDPDTVSGKSTEEMKTQLIFMNAGWSFLDTWAMPSDSYPRLAWSWIGNINPDNDGQQYAYGENVGWLNLDHPTQGSGVNVSATGLAGFIWAENIGWINLSPAYYGGVVNDGDGSLSGYAWGENVGWINFNPIVSGDTTEYGVTIDYDGNFSGWAWGENIGWLSLSCANTSSCDAVNYSTKVCAVNIYDLAALADAWLDSGVMADVDSSGRVDLADFNVLSMYWLDYCFSGWGL